MRSKRKPAWQGGLKSKIVHQTYPRQAGLSRTNFRFSYRPRKIPRKPANRPVKQTVFEALRQNPAVTSAELAGIMGLDTQITDQRLPALERAGLARKGRARVCEARQRQCVTWWPSVDVEGSLFYEPERN